MRRKHIYGIIFLIIESYIICTGHQFVRQFHVRDNVQILRWPQLANFKSQSYENYENSPIYDKFLNITRKKFEAYLF